MTNINLDAIRVGAAPLGVGDEVVAAPATTDQKILTGSNVTVSSAFDTLIDKFAREIEKSLDSQARTRLSLAIQTLAKRAGITNAAQLAALKECDDCLNDIATAQQKIKDTESERYRLQKELEAAQAAGEEWTGTPIGELQAQIASCNTRIGELNTSISDSTEKYNAALAKLDDKSSRVFAAAVRVSSTARQSYVELIRELSTDRDNNRLEAIQAFARLLGDDDIEKVLLEELGIQA